MLFPADLGPGIIIDIIQYGCFIHSHGGKLYGIRITGHVVCDTLIIPKGLNPSGASPSLTLRASFANLVCSLSKCFHALESAGWRIVPSSTRPSLCHCISKDVSFVINSLCSRGVSGKYRRTFRGTGFFDLRLGPVSSGSLEATVFHLDSPQTGQLSNLAYSLRNNTQSLVHACIFS